MNATVKTMTAEERERILNWAKESDLNCYVENGYQWFEMTVDGNRILFYDPNVSFESLEREYNAVDNFSRGYDLSDEELDLIDDVLCWGDDEYARESYYTLL